MSDRLRVGVIGGGLIAQVEHLPNLLALRQKFDLKGVSDPSPTVQKGLAERFGVATFAEARDILALNLDAVIIAAPDPWHAELALQALNAGLHVFCEKPLCYGLAEIDALAEAQRRGGKVLQVGYMKRFDPSFEAALEIVAGKAEQLRYISVEVHDPDAGPFVGHHSLVSSQNDVPPELLAQTAQRRRSQIEAALGFSADDTIYRGFSGTYCSALVHDVNAVHGLLDAIGLDTGPVLGAALFAAGSGGQAAIALKEGQALWTMTHVEIPGVPDYRDRISLYFEDEIVDLVFPAPYLNHYPTQLVRRKANGGGLETTSLRPGFGEAFVRELEGFWSAVVEGTPQRNTITQARRDQALLIAMAQKAAGR